MENRISYLDRTYDEYRRDLLDVTRKYYYDIFERIDDASIGSWLIELVSDVGDNLSFAIDRAYQETNIDSAKQPSSLLNIARSNGLKIPGPKSAIVEVEITCTLPMNTSVVPGTSNSLSAADESYAPYIRRGTLFSDGSVNFELIEDVDFKTQFDSNGFSNRQEIPKKDGNGNIIGYIYRKLGMAVAGKSKIYKTTVSREDIRPFMTLTVRDNDILNIESVLVKQGESANQDPKIEEFYVDRESFEDKSGRPVQRYFEVDNLVDQYRFGYEDTDIKADGNGITYYQPVWTATDSIETPDGSEPIRMVMKGKWKRLKNKFITEFDDMSNLRITFGAGIRNRYGTIPDNASDFTKYMMSRMEANDYMGVLPEPNTTVYVLYRVGGGERSNIAANTLTNILYLNCNIEGNCADTMNNRKISAVRTSLKVNNPTPSYGGKDSPSADEIRHLIKHNFASQNRCVTVKDYYARLMMIEPKYGLPFRIGVSEENNKIVVYTLGLDYLGKLSSPLSEIVAENMKEYLSMYRMVNDFVEIRSGRIINLSFQVDIFADKAYDKGEVAKRVIELVRDYMDIRKHMMGEDIFLGDLEKEISKLDGVLNLIEMRCYNKVGDAYSDTVITQALTSQSACETEESTSELEENNRKIDLKASDKVLYGNVGTMYEIKYPNTDIMVNVKIR